MKGTARRALEELRARPGHVALAAAVIGLSAGPRVPAALLGAAAMVAGLLSAGPMRALACAAALLAGVAVADARLNALDGPNRGLVVAGSAPGPLRLMLDESPRATSRGWRAFASSGGRRLLVYGRGRPPAWFAGEEALASGSVRAPSRREAWLRHRHVGLVLEARGARLSGRTRGGAAGVVDAVRRRATRALAGRLPGAEAGLLRGMTLGDDAGLPRPQLADLRASGLGHIVAASGQNVALLVILIHALGAALGVGRNARLVVSLALIAFYVPLAGGGPSIQRAGVMGAATLVAALAARPSTRWYALLLAAVVTLTLDPASLEDPGWQLSFAAVAAIASLASPLSAALRARRLPRALADSVAITVAATVGTAPVSAAVFGAVPLAGVVANVLAAPVIAPVTWLGMAGAALAQASPQAGALVAAPAGPGLAFVLGIARLSARAPGAGLPVPWLLAAALAAGAALMIGVPAVRRALRSAVSRQGATRALPALALSVALVVALRAGGGDPAALPPPPAGTLRVSFLSIGQGDATLLQSGGESLLVDSGPDDGPILAELERAGARRLSVLLVTHAQADHLGGADSVLRRVGVGLLIDGRDGVREAQGEQMARAARARGVRSVSVSAGDRLRIGAITLDVLWPMAREPGPAPAGDPNDRAIVLLARAAGVSMLLTADAESNVLSRLDLPMVDILKVSHHGSEDAGLPRLLERLRPRLAVVEVGAGNTYGHPRASTLDALAAAGARVLRTDRDGTVVVEAGAGRLAMRRPQ